MNLEYVLKNKELLIAAKKSAIKQADVVLCPVKPLDPKADADKAADVVEIDAADATVLAAKLVINTTNLIDSHMDCHLPGIWKKSLQEKKQLFLLQEHKMQFENVIADSVADRLQAYTEKISFADLGLKYTGETEALVFGVQIKKDVNPFMFDLYKRGRVNQHSVGMQYVKYFLCLNTEEPAYSSEKANWDKYYPAVANKEVADEKGFFWAVTEARVIEGSAVLKGSNTVTPSLEIEIEKNTDIEPAPATQNTEPPAGTQKQTVNLFNLH